MDLESIMLNEMLEEVKNHMIFLICEILKKGTNKNLKLIGTDNKIMVTRGKRGWEEEKEDKDGQIYGV